MKKLIAIVVIAAMVLTMFATVANAASLLNFDGAYLTNVADVNADPTNYPAPWVPAKADTDVKGKIAGDGNIGNLFGLDYKYLHMQGWYSTDDALSDIGIQVNGGEIKWGYAVYDANLWDENGNSRTGSANPRRFNLTVELTKEETNSLKMYSKLEDGTEAAIKEITWGYKDAPVIIDYAPAAGTNSPLDGSAIWMNAEGEYAAAEFTTTGKFNKIALTTYWASDLSKGVPVTFTMDLFKFASNVENTLAQTPVKSVSIEAVTNGNPAATLDLGEDFDAGTYILKVSVGGDHLTGDNDGSYMVLDHTPSEEVENVKYIVNCAQAGNKTFAFTVAGYKVDGNFFAANPEDTDVPATQPATQPETVPQTGDAELAIIAMVIVAVMAAAFVFAKRKTY